NSDRSCATAATITAASLGTRRHPDLVAFAEMADRAPRLAVVVSPGDRDVRAPLLSYLRNETLLPSLEYVAPPQSILGGFDTSIYGFQLDGAQAPLSDRLILRLLRS